MNEIQRIEREIQRIISAAMERNEIADRAGVVAEVMSEYEGEGSDRVLYLTRKCISDHVRQAMRKFGKAEHSLDSQLEIPGLKGWKHLRIGYIVKSRPNEIIPIQQMTHENWVEKRAEWSAMIRGMDEHIQESFDYEAAMGHQFGLTNA